MNYVLRRYSKAKRITRHYIEVKSVAEALKSRFFISRNEMEKAKQLGESYSLYLVNQQDQIEIIPDAYKSLYSKDQLKWVSKIENWSFTRD